MSLWDTFFLKSPISYPPLPLKSQLVGPLGLLRALRGGGGLLDKQKERLLGYKASYSHNYSQCYSLRGRRSKGKGRKFSRDTAHPESPFRSLLNACYAGYRWSRKGAWPNVVQSQSSAK